MSRTYLASHNNNTRSLTIDDVCAIEKELFDSPYDIISLVFLLYDVPDTALQRLLVFQQASKDIYSTNLTLLHEWVQEAKSKQNWSDYFLEALLICQLDGIIRKRGFDVKYLKSQYQPNSINHNMYIHPTKKALYRICENMNSENLITLKETLKTYGFDTISECESAELVFLKLMSERIISLTECQIDKKILQHHFNFDKLIKLLQKLPGLKSVVNELNNIQYRNNESMQTTGTSNLNISSDYTTTEKQLDDKENINIEDFSPIFDMLKNLNINDHMKSDSKKKLGNDAYPIKDAKKVGICLIINQEQFHLCDHSIEDPHLQGSLSNRKGSSIDKIQLERTMSLYNFEVITRDNLDHQKMAEFIKDSIHSKVNKDTSSIFILCIMSHGVRDHVFAADSVKIKIEDIQNMLDNEENLNGIPKILIIQACQVDDIPPTMLVADSPSPGNFQLNFRKLDFLVFLATSPEYEAYRDENSGSIFIQLICAAIKKLGKTDHLEDIFTKVNNAVYNFCTKKRCIQVPLSKSSLRKKLYLHIPE